MVRRGCLDVSEKRFFCFQKSIDRLWDPSRRLFDVNRWHFRSGHGGQDVKLTTRLYLVPRLGMNGAIPTITQMHSCRVQGEFCLYLQTVTEVKLWKINGWNGTRSVITLRNYISLNGSFFTKLMQQQQHGVGRVGIDVSLTELVVYTSWPV